MVIGLLVLALVLGLAFLPQLWVRSVLARYQQDRPDFPGTGAEFARHVLDGMGLEAVKVERTDLGDHYDPSEKAVRLSPPHYEGRSLAAVVVAAHEIGHAMQDATSYPPLAARTRLAGQAMRIEQIGMLVMLAAPLLTLLSRSPVVLLLDFAAGAVILSMAVLVHLVTLPVEFDASFRRALPVLEAGRFIPDDDMPAARRILRAAAFTYVAAAAMSLLNVARWLRVLRF